MSFPPQNIVPSIYRKSLFIRGAVDLVASVLAVEEAVLVLALLVNLAHHLLILLKLIISEEYGECLILLQDEPLPDDLQELLESEVKGYQIPIPRWLATMERLTSADLTPVAFAQWRTSR